MIEVLHGEHGHHLPRRPLRCVACGYGVSVRAAPPRCPMCGGSKWERETWRLFRSVKGPAGDPAAFRRLNERRRLAADDLGVDEFQFTCECEDAHCFETMRLGLDEFDFVRSDEAQFAVVPGHQGPLDEVVAATRRFAVVRRAPAAA